MKIKLLLDASADGYASKSEELRALLLMLEDLDSTAVSVRVISYERIDDEDCQ